MLSFASFAPDISLTSFEKIKTTRITRPVTYQSITLLTSKHDVNAMFDVIVDGNSESLKTFEPSGLFNSWTRLVRACSGRPRCTLTPGYPGPFPPTMPRPCCPRPGSTMSRVLCWSRTSCTKKASRGWWSHCNVRRMMMMLVRMMTGNRADDDSDHC